MSAAKNAVKGPGASAAVSKPGSFEYTAGLDVGNGYVKGTIERRLGKADEPGLRAGVLVDMPSVAATVTGPNLVPDADSTAREATGAGADWYNDLDVSFRSPLVTDGFRHLIGKKALATRSASTDEFDLAGNKSKAEQQLSKVLVLSVLAGRAVADYIAAHGELPGPDHDVSSLTVHATVALALPIDEFARHRDAYAAGFLGSGREGSSPTVHQVTVNNFETPVTVSIVFEDVMVLPEGMSAQYAINQHGVPLMELMLDDARSQGVEIDPEITAQDLLDATNAIGVDVGEGTVNFPVHTNGKPNVAASRTLSQGYGSVLERALASLESEGGTTSFTGRKQLADFLQGRRTKLNAKTFAVVDRHLGIAAKFFADEVALGLSHVLRDVGALTEVIYVYGGGSGPMREVLYRALVDKVREMNSENETPVLYLDARYSRGLNREGLILAARNRASQRAGTK